MKVHYNLGGRALRNKFWSCPDTVHTDAAANARSRPAAAHSSSTMGGASGLMRRFRKVVLAMFLLDALCFAALSFVEGTWSSSAGEALAPHGWGFVAKPSTGLRAAATEAVTFYIQSTFFLRTLL